jgi:hypothetical protein
MGREISDGLYLKDWLLRPKTRIRYVSPTMVCGEKYDVVYLQSQCRVSSIRGQVSTFTGIAIRVQSVCRDDLA